MANKNFTLKITNVLGGESPSSILSGEGQFQSSFGIDPDEDLNSNFSTTGSNLNGSLLTKPSGALVPVKTYSLTSTTLGIPQWIISAPKSPTDVSSQYYVYTSVGSVYTLGNLGVASVAGLGDLNDGASAAGNGAAYYDNYIYFARATTVARYGPLDGTPAFTDDYWIGTLGKTALTNTTYPTGQYSSTKFPNHVMKKHNDGKLYFADVVGNQGTIHYIATTKTTVEGDTDNGSKYDALDLPYNYWPTAIESYGSDLVIALVEADNRSGNLRSSRAKIVFWDTISDTYNKIIDFEFPDAFISKILNSNGNLYFFSGTSIQAAPLRISQYIGGSSFQEIVRLDNAYLPDPGAVSDDLPRIYFAGKYKPAVDENNAETSYGGRAAVQSLGSRLGAPFSLNTVMGTAWSTAAAITSVLYDNTLIWAGWASGDQSYGGLSVKGDSPAADGKRDQKNIWRSEIFTIGGPFKITKIRLPLAHTLENVSGNSVSKSITPYIWVDSGSFIHTLTTIDSSTQPNASNTRAAIVRPENATGYNDFFIELQWDTDEPLAVKLPIVIDGEYIDD